MPRNMGGKQACGRANARADHAISAGITCRHCTNTNSYQKSHELAMLQLHSSLFT